MADSPDRAPGAKAHRTKRERARSIGAIGLTAVFVLFAAVNLDQVQVDWIVTTSSTPLIVVIVLSFGLGLITALIGLKVRRARR